KPMVRAGHPAFGIRSELQSSPKSEMGQIRPSRCFVADAQFAFESGKSRRSKARRGRAFPRFSSTPDMFSAGHLLDDYSVLFFSQLFPGNVRFAPQAVNSLTIY